MNANLVKNEPATYALFHNEEMIYIGSTIDLDERFRLYWNSQFNNDPCKKLTNNYKREYRDDYLIREIELLKEFQRSYGRLPKCNDRIPSK